MPEWFEISLRTLAAVAILFMLTKILGKRQISQLSLFEYITGITIGNIAAYVSLDLDTLWYLGLVSIVVWTSVAVGMEYMTMKSRVIRDFVDGKGTVLIKDGQLYKQHLHKERLTLDELLEQLRKKDVYRVADVEFAVMEPSGEINVMLKKEHQPLTAEMIGWNLRPENEAKTVIIDGRVLNDMVDESGYSLEWLHHELKKKNLAPESVFLAQIDSDGELYVQTGDARPDHDNADRKPKDRIDALAKQFESELKRLGKLARNESDRRTYQSALDRFQAGYSPSMPDREQKP
ncbi:DUF421 domain-containing protein [Paenibacillus harenae]|uniref:Uncharacterized membrane protein YcaP (DUF421 family) n=1 Tax=Paenibacillus harenae TaxID=306543 RepID=A0ABT9U1I1_PAEHA|nr:DUF421 domain-containing protein [Paenibacillus harenae]MDQ0112274.1 uncharacterized membrane protein YcaP (DUF421 family) [Paenibacillus harenae]